MNENEEIIHLFNKYVQSTHHTYNTLGPMNMESHRARISAYMELLVCGFLPHFKPHVFLNISLQLKLSVQ